MKQILTLVLVIAVASCTNKKAQIVEQIKTYKDSLNMVGREVLDMTIAESQRYETYHHKEMNVDPLSWQSELLLKEYKEQERAITRKEMPIKVALQVKKWRYESKITSLELELKKY